MIETTLDDFLDHRLTLAQPKQGFRIAIDSLFLAAFTPAHVGEKVLELGCGVGGALIPLAFRVPGLTAKGIEIQAELAELCRQNAGRNDLSSVIDVHTGDLTAPPADWHGAFDHVLMNPPYQETDSHDLSSNAIKRIANAETMGDLSQWLSTAAMCLRQGGALTLIHKAERRTELIDQLAKNGFGSFTYQQLAPKQGAVAKRLLVRAKKGGVSPLNERPALILHKDDGKFTDAADAVLRGGKGL